jgi:hypothetical protein
MLRTSLCSMVALLVLAVGTARADDAKKDDEAKKKDDKGQHHMQATITKVDADKNTITVKTKDKDGKEEDKTLQLSKDAKVLNSAGKDEKLASLKAGDDVCLTQKDDKVTELRQHAEAKITKVDTKAGTITVKMTDKDGKTVEKTFRLVEESEYADSTGRISVLEIFQSGDDILFVEADGTIKAMKKAAKQEQTASKDSKKSSGK